MENYDQLWFFKSLYCICEAGAVSKGAFLPSFLSKSDATDLNVSQLEPDDSVVSDQHCKLCSL